MTTVPVHPAATRGEPAEPVRIPTVRRYLMCPPRHFAVQYVINPWMDPDVPVSVHEALRQWTDPATIRAELQRTHERWTAGEITDDERSAQEDALLARLMARSRAGITS